MASCLNPQPILFNPRSGLTSFIIPPGCTATAKSDWLTRYLCWVPFHRGWSSSKSSTSRDTRASSPSRHQATSHARSIQVPGGLRNPAWGETREGGAYAIEEEQNARVGWMDPSTSGGAAESTSSMYACATLGRGRRCSTAKPYSFTPTRAVTSFMKRLPGYVL